MKVVLALGNPGERYRDTRHNAGWWLAEHLVARWRLPPFRREGGAEWTGGTVAGVPLRLGRPLTFMNRSGRALDPLLARSRLDPERDLLVLVDDADQPPGRFRLRARGSSGGHNGLRSLEEAIGGREWARLRIGVGRPRDPDADLAAWLLSAPPPAEEEAVLEVFGRLAEAVECWIEEDIETAMNRFNAG